VVGPSHYAADRIVRSRLETVSPLLPIRAFGSSDFKGRQQERIENLESLLRPISGA